METEQEIRDNKKSFRRRLLYGFLLLDILGIVVAIILYRMICLNNIRPEAADSSLYIPTGTNYENLQLIISADSILKDEKGFFRLASLMKLNESIFPGRYILREGMNNYELISKIRGGMQDPVRVVLGKSRAVEQAIISLARQIEADTSSLREVFTHPDSLQAIGLDRWNAISLFIPDTYEFYWNTNASKAYLRMKREFEFFWNQDRLSKLEQLSLTRNEAIILASIVEEETNYNPEKSRMAGVYLNRLKAGMPLQADPTVKFAIGDFSLKRILYVHTQYPSPYNTYLHTGLPPGPICSPSIASMNAVLNAESNSYFYFCASVDSPGQHEFAVTYQQHLVNAARYQEYLNRLQP